MGNSNFLKLEGGVSQISMAVIITEERGSSTSSALCQTDFLAFW